MGQLLIGQLLIGQLLIVTWEAVTTTIDCYMGQLNGTNIDCCMGQDIRTIRVRQQRELSESKRRSVECQHQTGSETAVVFQP